MCGRGNRFLILLRSLSLCQVFVEWATYDSTVPRRENSVFKRQITRLTSAPCRDFCSRSVNGMKYYCFMTCWINGCFLNTPWCIHPSIVYRSMNINQSTDFQPPRFPGVGLGRSRNRATWPKWSTPQKPSVSPFALVHTSQGNPKAPVLNARSVFFVSVALPFVAASARTRWNEGEPG